MSFFTLIRLVSNGKKRKDTNVSFTHMPYEYIFRHIFEFNVLRTSRFPVINIFVLAKSISARPRFEPTTLGPRDRATSQLLYTRYQCSNPLMYYLTMAVLTMCDSKEARRQYSWTEEAKENRCADQIIRDILPAH